jgi:gliding-associated putative ABC transporter substrate-binding component GldG
MVKMAATQKSKSKTDVINFLGLIAIVILLNYVFSFFFGRFDLTEDKRHTLSPNTVAMLEDETRLTDRILFKIYLEGDLPADMKKIRNAVQEKLDEFIVYAGDNIQYEFINPDGTDDEEFNMAVKQSLYDKGRGIIPCDLEIIESGAAEIKTIWPGAVVEYKGMTVDHIQFFNKRTIFAQENTRDLADHTINNLEYMFISAVRRATAGDKQTVSFLQGQGELMPMQTEHIRMGLSRYYLMNDVVINGRLDALDNTDALIVAAPTQRFTEKDKYVIDQYIMKGGKVLWFVDPMFVDRDTLFYTGETYSGSSNLNIEKDMIYKYGVRMNTNLILDNDCAPLYIPAHPLGIVDWYYYPKLQRENHPITKNIDPVKAEYASSIDFVNEEYRGIQKTVLLKSSFKSLIYKARARVNYSIIDEGQRPNFDDGVQGDYPVAVLLEGVFPSAFENRIPEALASDPDFKAKFKSDSTKMLVVADGDIIRNEVDSVLKDGKMSYRSAPLHVDVYGVMNPNGTPKNIYGNRDFVLNAIDYMLDDYSLIDVRTKTITLRILDTEKIGKEKEFWRLVNILVPLFLISVLGFVQFVVRKRKFARI